MSGTMGKNYPTLAWNKIRGPAQDLRKPQMQNAAADLLPILVGKPECKF